VTWDTPSDKPVTCATLPSTETPTTPGLIGGGSGEGQLAAAGVLETGLEGLLVADEDLLLGDGVAAIGGGVRSAAHGEQDHCGGE